MAMHESSVNFQNLIKDLAEIYPFDVDEVVLVELIANSLDAKPTRISIDFDRNKKSLVVTDNGKGMTAKDFEQYHDFAAGLKTRGVGIGFAGIGAKISFNIAKRVVTETYSQSFFGGSNWYLQSKKKLIWENIQPEHLKQQGTRVEVFFSKDAKLSYSSTDDILKIIKRHYLPLLDMKYLELYGQLNCYSRDLRFIINGQIIDPIEIIQYFDLEKVRKFIPKKYGKRIGYGILGLSSSEYPVGADISGILLCTLGKVIKADLFNQFPGIIGSRIFGVVEIPEFVNFLTTAKTDFIRRSRHRKFESLYNPIRQEFKSWLEELGVQSQEIIGNNEAIKLEKELKKMLDDIPELSDFFGFRTRKTILQPDNRGTIKAIQKEGREITFPDGKGEKGKGLGYHDDGEQPGTAFSEDKKNGTQAAKPISRVSHRGPKITFIEAPDRKDLAWVEGNNIAINCGHPSYIRVRYNSIAKRIQNLFAIASAIQRFIANERDDGKLMFIDRMMAAWGEKK
jgi:hypothetical protein